MPAEQPHGVLLLDKPEGYSSTQALARAKRFLQARKAGHTGTLDPFATGLLPLVFGEATKFARFVLDATKTYRATLRLGVETSTGDTEGIELARVPVQVDAGLIDDVLARFVGVSDQIPPMHSAVRVAGKRLYQLARDGHEIEREPRRIEIFTMRRVAFRDDELTVDVSCSKGTYVRTLAIEVGRALGTGAYLTGLRRTAAGPFRLEQAVGLETLEAEGPAAARARLLPVDLLVADLPRRDLGEAEALRFTQGQDIGITAGMPPELAVFGPRGAFLGVATCSGDRMAPLRLMATHCVVQAP